jgi:hypothetical protein
MSDKPKAEVLTDEELVRVKSGLANLKRKDVVNSQFAKDFKSAVATIDALTKERDRLIRELETTAFSRNVCSASLNAIERDHDAMLPVVKAAMGERYSDFRGGAGDLGAAIDNLRRDHPKLVKRITNQEMSHD